MSVSVLGRLARGLHPGLWKVRAQVARYAADWEKANGVAVVGAGPLWVVLGVALPSRFPEPGQPPHRLGSEES